MVVRHLSAGSRHTYSRVLAALLVSCSPYMASCQATAATPPPSPSPSRGSSAGRGAPVYVRDIVGGVLNVLDEIAPVLNANHLAVTKVALALQAATSLSGQGSVDLVVVSFGASTDRSRTQEISFDIEPPKPTRPALESAFDIEEFIKTGLKDQLAQNIASAVAVREKVRCTRPGRASLDLKSFDTKISFAATKGADGKVGFTVLVFKIGAGGGLKSGETNTLSISIGPDPESPPTPCPM